MAALLVTLESSAGAQTPPPDQTTTPTTVNGLQDLLTKLLGGATAAPAPATPAAPGAAGPAAPAPAPGATPPPPAVAADAKTTPDATHVVPPDAQAMINSITRTGGRNTGELLTALRQLVDLGLSPEEAAVMGMGHFPVAGQAAYNDDFLMPRFTPSFHTHQGNDIFASEGTPVRAPEDGTARFSEDPVSGKSVYVTTANGTFYFGCHLAGYADIGGGRVTQGQIIGSVGNTGDASGGSPHLHFEIHPGGGAAVNPKPILDGWLNDALANVAKIVASYQQVGLPRPLTFTGSLRRFDEPLAGGSGIANLLATSSSNPGVRRLSELRASRDLASDSSKADAAVADAWKAAEQSSRSLLALVTPSALQTVLVHDSN
ncbi:MAG: M23 family metallopeptidase [Acidimicrobiales bacterium]